MTEKSDRFSKRARRVLNLAQAEALRLNHNYIGTEHLLLGLIREIDGVAGKVLAILGVEAGQVILAIEQAVGRGQRTPFGKPALAPRCKRVIELAVEEAQWMQHAYVGTEHILLGMLREGEGIGVQVLRTFVNLDKVRTTTVAAITGPHVNLLGQETESPLHELQTRYMTARSFLQEAQMRQLNDEAVQAERTRLARDLHDSIKQQLFSINVSAAAVRERWEKDVAGARAALDDVQHSAQAALVEMDALLKQLRPDPLETAGLVEALREQCEALAFRTGAEVTTFFGELPPETQLPLDTHVTIFRIVQEALANVARHARAGRVHVRLESEPAAQVLRLEVRDDGQGFEYATSSSGMGLANMAQRAQSLQGQIEINSSGQGTTVQVTIPLLPQPDV